jgi:AcrR family transcriptional regulator
MSDRPPNTNPESAQTRERLLDAAEKLFAERGFRSASVRDITREASCNIASVNYHFGGKSNLYREVFLRRLRDLRERRVAVIERVRGERPSLERLLSAFATAFVHPLVEEAPGRLWVLLVSQELIDPQLPPDMFYGEMLDPLQKALVGAVVEATPGLDLDDAALAMHSLIGQLFHMVKLQRFPPGRPAPSLTELVEHTVRFSAAGIRSLQRVPA